MIRPRIIIVSRYPSCAEALVSYCRALLPTDRAPHAIEKLVFESSGELFEKLNALVPSEAAETMIVYDACADQHRLWDAAGLGVRDRGIGVQLVLQYPELYFVFIRGDDPSFTDEIRSLHVVSLSDLSKLIELINLHGGGFRVLYDPTGLRSTLKESLITGDGVKRNRYLPAWTMRLKQSACVIEDEVTFAQFNSYAAYRAGFRVYTATSYKELTRLLPDRTQTDLDAPLVFHTIITDWDVRFVDFVPTDEDANLNLETRLRNSGARVFVVTSQKNAAIEGFLKSLRDLKVQGIVEGDSARATAADGRCVAKPYAGIFELVELLQTDSLFTPEHFSLSTLERHTAAYASSLVAENLMLRAKRMPDASDRDQRLLLQQAMLVGEAKEILGGLSPTTFFETLSQQNRAEIRAEASYLGMLTEIQPGSRLRAFEEETGNSVLSDARDAEMAKARLNYAIQQITSFRRIYNEYESVTAAEICLRKIARHQRLQLRHGSLSNRSWECGTQT